MWKYQELLNQNLQILLLISIGFITCLLRVFQQKTDLAAINKLVFRILLPSSVLLGLGLKSDLRNHEIWQFVAAFLLIRAFCFVGAFLFFGIILKQNISIITINWLVISWVSTVILGVPLLRASLGPEYSNLGVVAGVSSFIFQLPVMLILLEGNAEYQRHSSATLNSTATTTTTTTIATPSGVDDKQKLPLTIPPSPLPSSPSSLNGTIPTIANATPRYRYHLPSLTKHQWKRIALKLSTNPILWSIVIGIILSTTTLGPKYLNPGTPPLQPNCSYAVGTGFIQLLLTSLAACTEPIALLGTGIFLANKNPLKIGIWRTILYMGVKLILVPALAIGCAAAVGLKGAPARAAVLLASLPISAASFALASEYGVGEHEVTANVFFGNLLVLPTTIAWMAFMDGIDLFTYTSTSSSNNNNSGGGGCATACAKLG